MRSYRIAYLALLAGPDSMIVKQRLGELGYSEGKNLIFDYRSAEGQSERLPALAAEFVRTNPDVIVAGFGTLTAKAAQAATATIPIVFTTVGDPIGSGLVASLHRPGANVTGLSGQAREIVGKRLQILEELVPGIRIVAVLLNPDTPFSALGLQDFFELRGNLGDWCQVAQLGLVAAQRDRNGHAVALSHRSLGIVHLYQGDFPPAVQHLRASLTAGMRRGGVKTTAVTLRSLGEALSDVFRGLAPQLAAQKEWVLVAPLSGGLVEHAGVAGHGEVGDRDARGGVPQFRVAGECADDGQGGVVGHGGSSPVVDRGCGFCRSVTLTRYKARLSAPAGRPGPPVGGRAATVPCGVRGPRAGSPWTTEDDGKQWPIG